MENDILINETGCEWFDNGDCNITHDGCIENPDCHYRHIAKLETENSDLKKYIERMDKPEIKTIDSEIFLENTKLKQALENLISEIKFIWCGARQTEYVCHRVNWENQFNKVIDLCNEYKKKYIEVKNAND